MPSSVMRVDFESEPIDSLKSLTAKSTYPFQFKPKEIVTLRFAEEAGRR
jgi:hypothetical protein